MNNLNHKVINLRKRYLNYKYHIQLLQENLKENFKQYQKTIFIFNLR